MPVSGRMEITLKINDLPDVTTVENGWKQFNVLMDSGKVVTVTLKPKTWKKFEDAKANYPQWMAAITGKMGAATPKGFVLEEPAVQVFEKKPKEPKPEANAVAEGIK